MSKIILSTARTYVSRKQGHIGRAAMRIMSDGTMELSIDGDEFFTLPDSSRDHFLNFAMQSLQDAYAGAESTAAAKAAFTAKVAKLRDGTLGVRGEGVDEWTIAARNIVRPLVKAKRAAEYKAADADGRTAMVDAAIDKNRDNAAFVAKVDAEMARMKAEREALARAVAEAAESGITI